MPPKIIPESELILNSDGSVYHLNLLPEDIGDTVITVGDPDRVPKVSQYFDDIELKKGKREIITHTGRLGKHRITVLSTGIGTDNIDICLTELDALVNVDLGTRTIKPDLRSLNIIRLGTTGGLQPDAAVDSFVVTRYAFGFDSLLQFYRYDNDGAEQQLAQAAQSHFADAKLTPYVIGGSEGLHDLFVDQCHSGITATCCGFYGPQGRRVRAPLSIDDLMGELQRFQHQGKRIVNFEMETAGIYGLGKILNHHCCSLSAVMVNRHDKTVSNTPEETVDRLIRYGLETLSNKL
ncbi:MAG: phosphorylase [Legionellales bacterium]|nr:phosphorylase [Legionellales bacterium]|tara:strand:+ start:7823 stop:8701 length:879 start_codon:yes stop_codon:yes gene_type:complete